MLQRCNFHGDSSPCAANATSPGAASAYIQRQMIYFIALFCSPLALVLSGRPFAALFNLILYVISIALWATILFAHAGFVVWALALLHAVLVIHDAREYRRMRRIMAATRLD